ncbi:hypothetical protein HanXRQr2_Chr09g0393831 [Helianthus annuus]|uniref:Uncharacterized protein n=1 Tax=Helianthus annuus TaxID=4232 RepID=A0A9K3I6G0_HELAN|nr:hypothetical protein HanXRQr2_Chr09g0393831 [Helianthus annuus]KAJ0542826.1 hypothetical protein HanHA89_Chr09g0344111 [Helianthus annuus]
MIKTKINHTKHTLSVCLVDVKHRGDQVSPSNPKSPKIHKLKPLICSKSSFKHELVIISLRGSKV